MKNEGFAGCLVNACACVWVCLGEKAADRITHLKWEEPHQEVV